MHEERNLRRFALESKKTSSKKLKSKPTSREASALNSRTNSRAPSRNVSDDEAEGNMSDSTNWSTNSIDDMLSVDAPEEVSEEVWKAELADRIEDLIDRKRGRGVVGREGTPGREATLARYVHILMSQYASDTIESKTSELYPALLKSVKSGGSEKETSLALRAIALTLITCPNDDIHEALHKPLKTAYTDCEYVSVKVAAIHALGVSAIYGGASESAIDEIMDDLLEIVESDGSSIGAEDSGEAVTAACEEWGFLAAIQDNVEDKTETAMDAFVEQLDSSVTAVQVAAGENIALLYEKSFTERQSDDEDPQGDEIDEEGFAVWGGMVKRYEVYRQKNQLEHKLTQLTRESSKRISKKDRKTLHANFSDILHTVEHPWRGPRYSSAIDKETDKAYGSRMFVWIGKEGYLLIDTWWKLHRLQALRRVLGAGFMRHYDENAVVIETLPIFVGIKRE